MSLDEKHAAVRTKFIPSEGLSTADADQLLLKWGPNELEEKVKPAVII